MARTYYFHQIFRKINIAFLSLFKNIKVAKLDANGAVINYRNCPIVFGHKDKFLTKKDKKAKSEFNKYLPMISVIITSITKNPELNRGGSTTELTKYFNLSDTQITKLLGGVPYTLTYSLMIISKSLTEAEMIMEQIIPQFDPYENITIKEFSFITDFTRDIKVSLVGVTPDFIEEVDEGDIRRIEVELTFELDFWMYRPVILSDIIKTVKHEYIDTTLVPIITGNTLATYTYTVSGDSSNYDVPVDEWIDYE